MDVESQDYGSPRRQRLKEMIYSTHIMSTAVLPYSSIPGSFSKLFQALLFMMWALTFVFIVSERPRFALRYVVPALAVILVIVGVFLAVMGKFPSRADLYVPILTDLGFFISYSSELLISKLAWRMRMNQGVRPTRRQYPETANQDIDLGWMPPIRRDS